MNTATLTDKYVSTLPLRAALLSRNRYETRGDMASRWAAHTGRTKNACQRFIERVMHDIGRLSIMHADEICGYVLGVHAINIWGDEW